MMINCLRNTYYYYYYVDNWNLNFSSSEEHHLSDIEIFSDIMNVFIITFDQFKAFLQNKSINFYNFYTKNMKMILTPSFWMVY